MNQVLQLASMAATKSRQNWGDLLEDEEELPQPTTSGPDAKGVITKVEYIRNDKGEVVKRTTKTRVIKIEKKVYKVGMPGWGPHGPHKPADSLAASKPCSTHPSCTCQAVPPAWLLTSGTPPAAGCPGAPRKLEEVWRRGDRACHRLCDGAVGGGGAL